MFGPWCSFIIFNYPQPTRQSLSQIKQSETPTRWMGKPLAAVKPRRTYKAGHSFEKKPQLYCTFGQASTPTVRLQSNQDVASAASAEIPVLSCWIKWILRLSHRQVCWKVASHEKNLAGCQKLRIQKQKCLACGRFKNIQPTGPVFWVLV